MMNGCYKSFCNSNLDFLLSTLNPPPPQRLQLYWPLRVQTLIETGRNTLTYSASDKNCYSNYTIVYYLSQMLKQPKPTDVIISQKSFAKELLLQILHTDTHSMFFHNIPGMSSSIAVQGWSLTKGVWLNLPYVVQKVTTFMYSCVLKNGLCKEITMRWEYYKVKTVTVSGHWKVWQEMWVKYQTREGIFFNYIFV